MHLSLCARVSGRLALLILKNNPEHVFVFLFFFLSSLDLLIGAEYYVELELNSYTMISWFLHLFENKCVFQLTVVWEEGE